MAQVLLGSRFPRTSNGISTRVPSPESRSNTEAAAEGLAHIQSAESRTVGRNPS